MMPGRHTCRGRVVTRSNAGLTIFIVESKETSGPEAVRYSKPVKCYLKFNIVTTIVNLKLCSAGRPLGF